MERMHLDRDPMKPRIYYASSISDMLLSRAQVMEDLRDLEGKFGRVGNFDQRRLRLHRIKGGFALSSFSSKKVLAIRNAAFVVISNVRHFPNEDTEQIDPTLPIQEAKIQSLTIHDPTGDCDVFRIPKSDEKRVPEEIRPNFPVLKAQSWASDVYLLNSYYSNGENQFFLWGVQNRLANQKQEENIRSFIGKITFLPNT